MVVEFYVPDRGDVIWLSFDPQTGHEQAIRRLVIVLSPQDYNKLSGLAIVCPITSQKKGYPFEVEINEMTEIAEIKGTILADQVKSLDWNERKASFICEASSKVIDEVLEKLNMLIY